MTWPFENDTSAITKKLAKRSLQADKRRNIFLILTIILTTALLSGMFFTVFAKQRELKDNIRGQYQAVVMGATPEEIDRLSVQPEIGLKILVLLATKTAILQWNTLTKAGWF